MTGFKGPQLAAGMGGQIGGRIREGMGKEEKKEGEGKKWEKNGRVEFCLRCQNSFGRPWQSVIGYFGFRFTAAYN